VGIPCIMEPVDPDLLREAEKEGEPKELMEKVLKGEVSVTDAILEHGVSREAGIDIGPTLIGQFQYGMKTGIDMIKTPGGRLKILLKNDLSVESSNSWYTIFLSAIPMSVLNIRDWNRGK
jgi:hypothetical protein